MNSILIDFPESFESEWLTIRAPRPGDGAEINAAICEIFEDLKVWMPWARKIPILEESEVFARCKQCEFLLRQDLLLFSVSKGQIPWLAVVAYIGLTGIFRNLRLARAIFEQLPRQFWSVALALKAYARVPTPPLVSA